MKTNWKVILAFAGIFIAGAVTGTFWGVPVIRYFSPRPAPAEQFLTQRMRELTEGLSLTTDQATKIGPIVQQTAEDLKKARRESNKVTSAIFDAMYASIARELTDAQRVRLQEMQARDRARHSQWVNGRPKPHGDGPPHLGPNTPPQPEPAGPGTESPPMPQPAQ